MTSIGSRLLVPLFLGALWVSGCTPKADSTSASIPVAAVNTPAEQYAALQKFAKGIAIGPSISDYTVFVMFDPQCLHCARLWEEAKGLSGTVKFVWVPVSFFDGGSKAQSALLLSSTTPREDMDKAMAAVIDRIPTAKTEEAVPPYLEASIQSNTDLINRFRVLAVPYVVSRNQTTSAFVSRQGGMSKDMLQRFLGIGSR
jgi:thiol:disulfide interchange protein DsbG